MLLNSRKKLLSAFIAADDAFHADRARTAISLAGNVTNQRQTICRQQFICC